VRKCYGCKCEFLPAVPPNDQQVLVRAESHWYWDKQSMNGLGRKSNWYYHILPQSVRPQSFLNGISSLHSLLILSHFVGELSCQYLKIATRNRISRTSDITFALSAILNSQAGYRCALVLKTPVPGSPLLVLVTSIYFLVFIFSTAADKRKKVIYLIKKWKRTDSLLFKTQI